MAEILFYHLTETRLEETLPPLLEKTLQRDWRACIHCGDQAAMEELDNYLWTYRPDSFLAHGTDTSPDFSANQPILLTLSKDAANDAHVRFVVKMGPEPGLNSCERVVYLFDGHDQDQLEMARSQWKAFGQSGVEKTYWQQTPERRWVKKA